VAVRNPALATGGVRQVAGPARGRDEVVKDRGRGGGPVWRPRRGPGPRESVLERSPATC